MQTHCTTDITKSIQVKDVKFPHPHQEIALRALDQATQQYNRYSCVMACGTGKTLVALWHAEQMQAKKILVLLPSLGLMNQTLHEWLTNTQLPSLKYICVCSDQSMSRDDDFIQYRPEELDFHVTTQGSEVTQFLNACDDSDTIVIFSTYHSANVVGEGVGKDFQFDLIIFDEAHKTAGEAGKAFSYALYDKNIAADKRLFMTATPRVVNQHTINQNKIDDIKKNYISMCDISLYGPTVYQLNFKQAVGLGIIVDYKVIISIVTSEMVDKALRNAKVNFKNKKIEALPVAHMLAIQHAAQEHHIAKLITFHSRVKNAAIFENMISEHWFDLLDNFNAQHVSGTMPTSQREQHINSFKNSKNSILTNARCLTEGIDVPVVDMIAFLCNKKSRVDIVQAAGRVMRKAPGKQTGYILLPFYIKNDAHHIEETLKNLRYADYADIWHILQVLADYDENLKDIIHVARIQQGESNNIIHEILSQKIIITSPSTLPINILKNSIQTLVIENISDNWYYYYEQLKNFKQKNKHCHIPKNYTKNKKLGHWVHTQRKSYKKGDLNLERKEKLNILGFIWDTKEAYWQEMYIKLLIFHQKHKHCDASRYDIENKELGRWILSQRASYHKGSLSLERQKKLEELNFTWNLKEARWQESYAELIDFQKKYGHCNVPQDYLENKKFGLWVNTQRSLYKKGDLSLERKEKLNILGFIWDIYENIWNEKYTQLKAYKENFGHCNVALHDKKNKYLYLWTINQRKNYKKNKLNSNQIKMLNDLNFTWDIKEFFWLEKYAELVKFHKSNSHCNVPKSSGKLGEWIIHQRNNYKSGQLTEDRIALLNKLHFVWDVLTHAWEKNYLLLKEFYNENKNFDIDPKINRSLYNWIMDQRQAYKKGTLSTNRKLKLEEIGISWDIFKTRWEKNYNDLIIFHQKHGHCNVPLDYAENPSLKNWFDKQKTMYRKGTLHPERKCKLDKLDFIWDRKKHLNKVN